MTVNQQKHFVEIQAIKLDVKVKKTILTILKEVLGLVVGFKGIFVPSKSGRVNKYKLTLLGMLLAFVYLVIIIGRG